MPRDRVYPQEHNSILGALDVEIDPKPEVLVRVWFFIVPETSRVARVDRSGITSKAVAKFLAGKPERQWSLAKRRGDLNRALASDSDGPKRFEVREWGVGFLMEPTEHHEKRKH